MAKIHFFRKNKKAPTLSRRSFSLEIAFIMDTISSDRRANAPTL